jgi:hypothetical protein
MMGACGGKKKTLNGIQMEEEEEKYENEVGDGDGDGDGEVSQYVITFITVVVV